ncbi:MAG: hypothetical protein PUC73_01990 [Lachnospiraceae bacterium]|nr:hypothetical protein [Lachnospiraceae bacterium]
MFFSKFNARVDQLERLVKEIDSNMEINYKDAAQSAFRELTEQFQKLQKEGKLNERQEIRYSDIIPSLANTARNRYNEFVAKRCKSTGNLLHQGKEGRL